jgi:hypothetical protein
MGDRVSLTDQFTCAKVPPKIRVGDWPDSHYKQADKQENNKKLPDRHTHGLILHERGSCWLPLS